MSDPNDGFVSAIELAQRGLREARVALERHEAWRRELLELRAYLVNAVVTETHDAADAAERDDAAVKEYCDGRHDAFREVLARLERFDEPASTILDASLVSLDNNAQGR